MPAQNPKPIYALVGADSFLQLQKLREIMALLGSDAQRVDVDGERAQLADVLDELRSFAMFGGAKVVVVRTADDFVSRYREKLEDYALAPSTSATLVLRMSALPSNQRIYKAIAKTGQIEECNPPKEKDLPRWIVEHARAAHGLKITPDAAIILAEQIGGDMGRIDTELAKLALSAENGQADAPLVASVVSFGRERQMWEMTNEMASGRTQEAIVRWRQLLRTDPSAEFRAVTWLGMWLENVRKALAMKRRGMNESAIGSALRIWPRENVVSFLQTATTMGEAGAAAALDLLVNVDLQSKSGVGDFASNVEQFLLEVGRGSAAANSHASSNWRRKG